VNNAEKMGVNKTWILEWKKEQVQMTAGFAEDNPDVNIEEILNKSMGTWPTTENSSINAILRS